MEKDDTSTFRCGYKDFEIGDPITNTAVFASRGIIGIPGVSKVHLTENELVPSVQFCVPDLLVGIDSSGSMDAPNARTGAVQTLAAFILGRNYHANSARIGGWNFSTDIATIPLSRDLETFYSLMCAYWGGGTFINTKKLSQYLAKLYPSEQEVRAFTQEGNIPHLHAYSHSERRMFEDKNLRVDIKKVHENAAKLDNVLITDGYLANPEEVIKYLAGLGKVTRNFVFLTDKAMYTEWKKLKIPSTWVYLADTKTALVNLSVGLSLSLGADATRTYGEEPSTLRI